MPSSDTTSTPSLRFDRNPVSPADQTDEDSQVAEDCAQAAIDAVHSLYPGAQVKSFNKTISAYIIHFDCIQNANATALQRRLRFRTGLKCTVDVHSALTSGNSVVVVVTVPVAQIKWGKLERYSCFQIMAALLLLAGVAVALFAPKEDVARVVRELAVKIFQRSE